MTKDDYITWWRDRYNNLVSTLIRAVDGESVSFDDNDEFPHSDGAKMLLERITSLTAECSVLLTAIAEIAGQKLSKEMEMPNHADYHFAYEEMIRVARIASDSVSGKQVQDD